MKTQLTCLAVTAFVALNLSHAAPALADTSDSSSKQDKLKGLVTAVDRSDKTVFVKGFWKTKMLNVASDCLIELPEKPAATLADIRPGQRVEVRYENARGVLVAHRISQHPVTFDGRVTAFDAAQHTMTVRRRFLDKTFRIADDCRIVMPGNKSGTLGDVEAGDRVVVTFETPNKQPTAHQIAQTSRTFKGTLTAIDANERTVKAKSFLNAKTFRLEQDCSIVVDGNRPGSLHDLRVGDEMVFCYEDVDGIPVASYVGRDSPPASKIVPTASRTDGVQRDMNGLSSR